MYNKDNELLGQEYIEIDNLQPKETKTYELKFKYDNVDRFIIINLDEKVNL